MQTVDSFKNRLEKALTIKSIKPVELHEKTGLSESLISKYLSGNAIPRQRKIDLIAEVLDINPVWLLGYDVPMEKKSDLISEQLKNIGAMYVSNTDLVKIPLLGTVKAGYDYMAQENWTGYVDVEKEIVKDGQEYFALKVHGDSMSPVLIEDDIVIIKKQNDFENGDIVVAIINGDEATIKKGKKSDSSILLQPLNPSYEPLIFTYDEMKTIPVKIIGIVKQLKREF